MLLQLVVLVGALAPGQTSGYESRIACDRAFKYVDTAFRGYVPGGGGSTAIYWRRNQGPGAATYQVGDGNASAPDVDVDDYGNSVVAWNGLDPTGTYPVLYLGIFPCSGGVVGTPLGPFVVSTSGGLMPRVAIGRDNGKITVAWQNGGSTPGGHAFAGGSISARPFNLSGTPLAAEAIVATSAYNQYYCFGGVAAAANGDPIIGYLKYSTGTSPVLFKACTLALNAGTTTQRYAESVIQTYSTTNGGSYPGGSSGSNAGYYYCEVAAFNDGSAVLANNLAGNATTVLNVAHADGTGAATGVDTGIYSSSTAMVDGPVGASGVAPFQIDCRKSSPGHNDYVVAWNAGPGNYQGTSIFYRKVIAGVAYPLAGSSPPDYCAAAGSGYPGPTVYHKAPGVAVADSGVNGVNPPCDFAISYWVNGGYGPPSLYESQF